MFSNIPINLLSETQLGGCTALSCVLGRRREAVGGGGRVDICSNKEGNVCEPAVCAHRRSNAHTRSRPVTGWMWRCSTLAHLLGCVLILGLCCKGSQRGQRCLCTWLTVVSRCTTHSSLVSPLNSRTFRVPCCQPVSLRTSQTRCLLFCTCVYFEWAAILGQFWRFFCIFRRFFFSPS